MKTLIGKNGYLFLQNDSANEIESHSRNETKVKNYAYIKKENYLLTVFPNKSFLLKEFLPDTYLLRYRSAFDKYFEVLEDHILDGYKILKDLNVFYKTDTHINLYGACEMYYHFVDKINELFNLNIIKEEISIKKKECVLSTLKKGLGDLTWVENKGDQIIDDLNDTYYFSEEVPEVLLECTIEVHSPLRILDYNLNDVNDVLHGNAINWDIISNYILFMKNADKKFRVIVFYDSFLNSTMSLYLTMFSEVYMIKKMYNVELIEKLKPDYVFEFRVERFLR